MGIIDSTYHRIICTGCGTAETHTAHQKGSSFSPGSWSIYENAGSFNVSVDSNDEVNGPRLVSAKCKKCQAEAQIEFASFSKPKGW